MKNIVLYIALFLTLDLYGQVPVLEDTISISEVVITRKNAMIQAPGFRKIRIDSTVLQGYSHGTIADMLSANSPVFIKNYGAGGLATPSFRGTSPGHTLITWNDLNINNPMLGQFDLSLVPAGFIDEVDIFYGGASMEHSAGGIGGKINLSTKPDWSKKSVAVLNPGTGSFGRYSGLVSLKTGTSSFQSVTKAFIQTSENNFPYTDYTGGGEPQKETRINNQVQQKGIIQELYLKSEKSILSASLWYQSASRNLPAPIIAGNMNSGERQNDESLRTLLKYDAFRGKTNYRISASLSSDKINYINRPASVDSRNNGRTFTLRTGFETRVNEDLRIKVDLNDELNFISSNNYYGNKTRNISSFTASAQGTFFNWLTTSLLLREILVDDNLLTPDFSAAAQVKIVKGKEYFVKANFSKNSRIPTLNDMYWLPGGNPDLRNESGYTWELSYEMNSAVGHAMKIQSDITMFRNIITGMIQWQPGVFSYWTPQNLGIINTAGFESDFNLSYSVNKVKLLLHVGYSYTRAEKSGKNGDTSVNTGKQLIYVPVNLLNSGIRIIWGNAFLSFLTNFTDRRFIDADNSQYLPSYTTSSIDIGKRFISKIINVDINIKIDNLFNTSYQNIAWYPMPGRTVLVSVKLQKER